MFVDPWLLSYWAVLVLPLLAMAAMCWPSHITALEEGVGQRLSKLPNKNHWQESPVVDLGVLSEAGGLPLDAPLGKMVPCSCNPLCCSEPRTGSV